MNNDLIEYPCGHKGRTEYCQRCLDDIRMELYREQEREKDERRRRQKQREREQWKASFGDDPIDLRGLPKRIVEKMRGKIDELEAGVPLRKLGGRRLNRDRNTISVKITYDYRLVLRDTGDDIVPYDALTHESYNAKYGD